MPARVRSGPARSLLYLRTVRHLRPVQVYWRIWFHLYRPATDDAPAPALRKRAGAWQAPVERPATMTAPGSFCLLNRAGVVKTAADWNDRGQDKLWLYNVHYFDDLNASASDASRQAWHRNLIARWIAENPSGDGNGWEPYPLSLRIVNWIKWALAGNALEAQWTQSLAVQARFLHKRVEWHLLGNHLFANAKALLFAGLFFDGREAERWRDTALKILAQQAPEQVLADGGHFELSPMYHAIIQEDLLDLLNLARAYPGVLPDSAVAVWMETLARMRTWLSVMNHPDGEIAFFNDAAIGIAAAPLDLERYAVRLGLPPCEKPAKMVTHLEQSGYVRVQFGDCVAFLDVGRIGPDYLPGHAHADTLSFELSFFGQRTIVNSGTSVYGTGPERQHQRSTAAHSTVEVDGRDSSEVWGGFRVARRARPFGLTIEHDAGEVRVRCAHDGYRRLPGRVTHWREWRFSPTGVSVSDALQGRYRQAIGRFHLNPDVRIVPGERAIVLGGGQRLAFSVNGGSAEIVLGSYHPRFGVSEATQTLEIAFSQARCDIDFQLT